MKITKVIFFWLVFLVVQSANAWTSHFLITDAALRNMPEISKVPTIPAETLTSFVESESAGLVVLLKEIDEWPSHLKTITPPPSHRAVVQLASYPAIPVVLTFNGKASAGESLLKQFLQRARINPDYSYDKLFLQYAPGETHRFHHPLSKEEIVLSSIADTIPLASPPLEQINSGNKVSAFEIITSAVDEPDYGIDIGLWKDSGTTFGNIYQLGQQPFGNKTTPISSQAPFHMGFYYESPVEYFFADFLNHVYPEYRIHYFLALSRYAFKTGHDYWGYRFLAWSLHYMQDLGQPYHSTLSPNTSVISLIIKNAIGGSVKQDLIQVITNRHFSLENYEYNLLKNEFKKNSTHSRFILALEQGKELNQQKYNDLYPRQVIAVQSHAQANQVDELINHEFPDYVKPNYIFNLSDLTLDLYSKVNQNDPEVEALNQELIKLLQALGLHTRYAIKYALS